MNDKTISENLKRLRRVKKLSQDSLAEAAGISRGAYRKIESGQSEPKVKNLQAIALSLGVRIEDILAPVSELRAVRFRSSKRLRTREQILVDVGRWLRDFNELEDILGDKKDYSLRKMKLQRKSKDKAINAAAQLRHIFGLDEEEPIRDICGLLESKGIKVCSLPVASNDFFGLSVDPSEGGPAVVVNTWERISVERWIFTAAHELGHLVLHPADYNISQEEEPEDHEQEANEFASAFLMPESIFEKEWKETCGMAFVDRVLKVKRIFRVSYKTVLYHLAQKYKGNIWKCFQQEYKLRYGKYLLKQDEPEALAKNSFKASLPEYRSAGEPEHLSTHDFCQGRLLRLVRQAVEEAKISQTRAAEILGLSLGEMRKLTASWAYE